MGFWRLAGAVTLGWASIGGAAVSPEVLTLDQAMREAVEGSPEVAHAQAVVDEARWRRFEALGQGFLPRISASAHHFFDPHYTVTQVSLGPAPVPFPGFFPNTAASLEVTIPIFDGFANVARLGAAGLFETASEKDLDRSRFKLAEDVRLYFSQALAAAMLREVAEQNVKTLEDHLNQTKLRLRGGVATNYDSLRVEVQLNEARAEAIDTEDNAVLARKHLAMVMGKETDERVLEGSLPTPDPTKVKELTFDNVPKERTDIQALDARSAATGKIASAGYAWIMPSVFLTGQYLLYDQQIVSGTVTNTGRYLSAYNVAVMLKWNLFDGGVSLAQMREAAYREVQAEKKALIAKLEIPYDFAYWKRRYLSNTDHYRSKQFDITRSEESVRLAKAEQRAGSRTSSETLDAELDLFRARAGVVKAQLNAVEALVKLELALGRTL